MLRSLKTVHNGVQCYVPLISSVSHFTCITAPVLKDCTHATRSAFKSQNSNLITSSLCSTKILQPEAELSLLKKVLAKVRFAGHSKARLKAASYLLYENVADKINYLDFFNEFNLPNTFNSWFLVTELHVWMLLLRAMVEGSERGEDGRFVRNSIVEAMWSDVNTRAKKLGANNPSGTRAQIEILSEQFQAALIAYDEGIMSEDKVLAGALWRRFFEKNCDDYKLLEKLILYVRFHIKLLDSLTRDDFIKNQNLQWVPLTDLKI